jgi:hypothetical protein
MIAIRKRVGNEAFARFKGYLRVHAGKDPDHLVEELRGFRDNPPAHLGVFALSKDRFFEAGPEASQPSVANVNCVRVRLKWGQMGGAINRRRCL